MVRSTLIDLGFHPKEAEIYLTLLPLGHAHATTLSRKTNIPRTTIAYHCDQMVKRGVIRRHKRNQAYVYSPESPERLIYALTEQRKKLLEKEKQANRIMNALKAMINPQSVLPNVRFYQGYDGVKQSYEDMLKDCKATNTTSINAIFSVDEAIGKELQDFLLEDYVPSRVSMGITMKNICLESPKSHYYQSRDDLDLRETKMISTEYLPVNNTEINLYHNRMHHMSFNETDAYAMIVEDEAITLMLNAMFNILWNQIDSPGNANQ